VNLPKKVEKRLADGVKRFQPLLKRAKDRDINEADTVRLVTDILADLFGYDKYSQVTSEYAIRGRYVDLAITDSNDGRPQILIEVKSIGTELNDRHVRQAVDYAANEGVEWVLLTNGHVWRVYKIIFSQPVEHEIVDEIDILGIGHRAKRDLERLYPLTPEGISKNALEGQYRQRRVLNRFFVAAVIRSDPVIDAIRRELRRIEPDVKIGSEELLELIRSEVLKREVVEEDRAKEAERVVKRARNRLLRSRKKKAKEAEESKED